MFKKSKRVADREVNGERVIFSCKILKGYYKKINRQNTALDY